jgi:hypothetical protein
MFIAEVTLYSFGKIEIRVLHSQLGMIPIFMDVPIY